MPIFRHTASGPGPAGDVWSTTMHSFSNTASIATAAGSWFTLLTQFWGAGQLGQYLTVDQLLEEAVTDQLDPTTGKNTLQVRTAMTLKGNLAAEPTTPQRASIVTGLRTANATRAGRGRMFWPGPAGSQLTNVGQLTNAIANALAADLGGDLTTFNGTGVQAVIFHRKTLTYTPITQVTVSINLGTQRRRTNKLGGGYASYNI